jgi:hypothetical protein
MIIELDRHRRRRAQNIPTVSVLAGPPARVVRAFKRHLEEEARTVVECRALDRAFAERAIIGALFSHSELEGEAIRAVASAARRATEEVREDLACKSSIERELFFDSLPATAIVKAARAVLERDEERAKLAGLIALLGPQRTPGLILFAEEQIERSAELALALAIEHPALPLAIVVRGETVDAYLSGPETRTRAMLRETIVRLERAPAPKQHELARPFAEAVEAVESGDGDRARSAAERFLFAVLALQPATAGLFELNGKSAGMEIDLLCRDLRIAVELDGHFHFRGADDYRRDRRKDVKLQKEGFFVIRFLAEDVVERLEEVLETISAVIAHRRATSS